MRDAMRAGAVAAIVSGVPSTVWALVSGTDPLEPSLAAGAMVLPGTTGRVRLLVAAAGAHTVLSLGWAQVLAVVPTRPRLLRRSRAAGAARGAAAGLAIAALDLGLAHASRAPRLRAIRALPVLPQVADHVVYGAVVGGLLAGRT